MPSVKDRFTATLSQLRPAEITNDRPGRIELRVATSGRQRDVVLDGHRVTIGAHGANECVLVDDAVSNVHCELCPVADGVILRDLGSKNGTWLGPNVRVNSIHLRPGGVFEVGSSSFELLGIQDIAVPISTTGRFGQLHGCGSKMGELFSMLARLAAEPLNVLLVGETGTGKTITASSLHDRSSRSESPFVVVDCASFQGATTENAIIGGNGLLDEIAGGTLFFDNIEDTPSSFQPGMLRVLDQCRGDLDIRVISAAREDLTPLVGRGNFRDDLYFRLAQITLNIPALRDRGSVDIAALIELFLGQSSQERGRRFQFSEEALALLSEYRWPGNVRQLRDTVRCASVLAQGTQIEAHDLSSLRSLESPVVSAFENDGQLEQAFNEPLADARALFVRVYISRALRKTAGNQSAAARRIGVSRSTIRRLATKSEG